jgi:hypothetical protein
MMATNTCEVRKRGLGIIASTKLPGLGMDVRRGLCCAVLCRGVVPCCAVVLCCAVLCCAVPWSFVVLCRGAVLCCAVLCRGAVLCCECTIRAQFVPSLR